MLHTCVYDLRDHEVTMPGHTRVYGHACGAQRGLFIIDRYGRNFFQRSTTLRFERDVVHDIVLSLVRPDRAYARSDTRSDVPGRRSEKDAQLA
jgi:hypothetical protein